MQSTIATRIGTQPDATRLVVAGMALAAATAVAAVAIAFGPAVDLNLWASTPADASYTRVEAIRDQAFGSGTVDGYTRVEAIRGKAFGSSAADGSLDQAEKTRGAAFGAGGSVVDDTSYSHVENVRSLAVLPFGDRSYDGIEGLRSLR